MKALKVEFKHAFAVSLVALIDDLLGKHWDDDDDKLIMAGLAELRARLSKKTEAMQQKYTVKLTPVQSYSLRLLYTQFINDPTSYVGNKLSRIADSVHKTYQ